MKLLDLFCGAGGCAAGYSLAGFTSIVGVDIKPQPRYPFAFVQGDALAYLAEHCHDFDAIHASPPCQLHSRCRRIGNAKPGHPELVGPTRQMLKATGKPWVIENVEGAPLEWHVLLCGSMFGLPLIRHRGFESNIMLMQPGGCQNCHTGERYGVYASKVTKIGTRATAYEDSRGRTHYRPQLGTLEDGRRAMGIDWMDRDELSQAIPPAYTDFIGRQLIDAIRAKAGAA